MGENSNSDILEIEIDHSAFEYLKKNGDVFILTDVENPRYSYYKIKGYDGNLIIKFVEFVEICKTQTEFTITAFDVTSPANSNPSNLGFYVTKSGFSTVDNWLKKLKDSEAIPECSTPQKKTFYLYHIQTVA